MSKKQHTRRAPKRQSMRWALILPFLLYSIAGHSTCGTPTTATKNVTICPGSTYMLNTHTYSVAGTYNDTLKNSFGCDSIITTLTLAVDVVPTASINTTGSTICPGSSASVSGIIHAGSAWKVKLSNDSSKTGTKNDTTFSFSVSPTVSTGYYIKSITDSVGCNATMPTGLNYTMYSLFGGSGDLSQYGSYANSLSDFNTMFNTANSNTTVYETGFDSASAILNFSGSFVTSVPNGGSYFGIKYTGVFIAKETGTYSFQIDGDDAEDLLIGNTVVVSEYGGHGFSGYQTGTINLVAGTAYPIRIDFEQTGGGWGLAVQWQRPSQSSYSIQNDELGSASAAINVIQTAYTQNISVCSGHSVTIYDYDGVSHPHTYNSTGSYTVNPASKSGCDSTITLNLIVLAARNYVTMGGAGLKNGTSWANAMDSSIFRNTLPITCNGDTFWVAAGTYHPDLSNTNNTFAIPSGVAVYGGFAGTETALSARNVSAHITKLDGNNTNTIVSFNHASSSTILDGITLTHGYNYYGGGAAIENLGNGHDSSNPVINNCTFLYNNAYYSTGGINNDGNGGGNASPIITNCTFKYNTTGGYYTAGGAMCNIGYYSGKSNPVISYCTFIGNAGNFGGVMDNESYYNGVASPIINHCVFDSNTAYYNGGGVIYNDGGYSGNCSPKISDCSFSYNAANGGNNGGAIYNYGYSGICAGVITNCTFTSNSAYSGGAIYNNGEGGQFNDTLINCTFTSNTASYSGGAVYVDGAYGGNDKTVFISCGFNNNKAMNSAGGGVMNDGQNSGSCTPSYTRCTFTGNSAALGRGGAMDNDGFNYGSSTPTIVNCIFTKDTAGEGAAICNDGYQGNSSPTVTNCLFTKNVSGAGTIYNLGDNGGNVSMVCTNCTFALNDSLCIVNDNCTPTFNNCILWNDGGAELSEGNGSASTLNNTDIAGGWSGAGSSNKNADPKFVSTTNFSIQTSSPCINAGNTTYVPTGVTTDLAGNARIKYATVDMGAYEVGGCPDMFTSLTPASSTICSGSSQMFTINGLGAGLNVSWQYNSNPLGSGSTWTTFGTPNVDTATLNNITGTKYVRAVVSGSGCHPAASTQSALIKVDSASKLTYSNITSSTVTLTWTPEVGASTYTINYGGSTATTTSTTYTLTGLTPCTNYSIYVSPDYSVCSFSNSNTVSITTLPNSIILTLDTIAVHKVKAHWNGVKGNRYKLYVGTLVSLPNLTVFTVKDTAYTIDLSLATGYKGQTIFTYVLQDSGSNCSTKPVSNKQYLNIAGGTCTTAAPSGLVSTSTSTSLSVGWTGSSSYYSVFYKPVSGAGSSSWVAYRTNGSTYAFNHLQPNTCYVVFVANVCSLSPFKLGYTSAFDTICTLPTCSTPVNLVLSNATCHGFTATWNSVSGISNYSIYMTSLTGAGSPWSISYRSSTNAYTASIFGHSSTISVYIKANCSSSGQSLSSNTETISTLTTGCKDDMNQGSALASTVNAFNVYPNPNNGQFVINLTTANTTANATVQIINSIGQLVDQQVVSNNNGLVHTQLNYNSMAVGMYVVRVILGNETHTARIIIQK